MSDDMVIQGAIAEALSKAQGEFPPIKKGRTAKAGSYSYTYADLADVLEAVRPALAKHGLAVVQSIGGSDGKVSVSTALVHKDGGRFESSITVNALADLQKMGGQITYLRKYSFCAMIGVAAEDDLDGDVGQVAPARPQKEIRRVERPAAAPAADAPTAAQIAKLGVLVKSMALTPEECKAVALSFGSSDGSRKNLTKKGASEMIEFLEKCEEGDISANGQLNGILGVMLDTPEGGA